MPRHRRPRRVFLGLTNVAGYYSQLRAGFEEIGIGATLATFSEHGFSYADERNVPAPVRLARAVRRWRERSPRNVLGIAADIVVRLLLLLWAIARHDAFVFGYNSTFFRFRELPLIKLAGRRIVYMFHGSDSRPPFFDGALLTENDLTDEQVALRTKQQKQTIATIERWADVIVSYPVHSHFHTRPVVFTTLVGFPFDCQRATTSARGGDDVVIVHAPSVRASKGTAQIREAIERVRAKGHRINLIEISGRPHAEVLEAIAACDFVVDQLYSDAPISGIAAEAACLGKPAVIGGYAGREIARVYPEGTVPPTVYCRPEELAETIESLVVDPEKRQRIGAAARKYYDDNWGARAVAERFARLIEGDIPNEWMADVSDIRYVCGYGLTEQGAREAVRRLIEFGGRAALCVSDKPALEQRFVDFAAGGDGC